MCRDAFYGGAAGGGKSDALLMAALQFVDVKGYNALLIRDTYPNLTKPDGLLTRAHEWLHPWVKTGEIHWNGETKTFHFKLYGSTLGFGYLDGPNDHFNYQGAAYQFVGIDEVVNIREHQALYLFSRMRRLTGFSVPIRFRCASNPPHFEQLSRGEWVKERYVNPKTKRKNVIFIPAKMQDNPSLDVDDYKQSLANLDPITRRQLEEGDWDITVKDRFFQIDKIEIVDTFPLQRCSDICRRWDIAATEEKKKTRSESNDSGPAYTCGVKGAIVDEFFYILDIKRARLLPGEADQLILQTAIGDGLDVRQTAEQEPGSSGKRDMWHLSNLLKGYSFVGLPSTGSKIVRARPLASAMSMHKVKFLRAPWNKAALKELMMFPDSKLKDIVDSMASLYQDLDGTFGTQSQLTTIDSELMEAHQELDYLYEY